MGIRMRLLLQEKDSETQEREKMSKEYEAAVEVREAIRESTTQINEQLALIELTLREVSNVLYKLYNYQVFHITNED